jgi:hypothetical protein
MNEPPIQIRNPEVVRDIRLLAQRLNLPLTEVVGEAVRRCLAEDEIQRTARHAARSQALAAVLADIDALPHAGPAIADADLYDADGFPR